MAIFSRYPPDVTRAIKEMKRSGMNDPLPLLEVPRIATGKSNVDQLAGTVAAQFLKTSSLRPSSPQNRFTYATELEAYASSIEHLAKALAEFAAAVEPALAGANSLTPGVQFEAAVERARHTTNSAVAAEAASLAHAATFAMLASALASYAMKVHTAEDRVFAIQASTKADEAIRRHRTLFGR